MTRKKQRREHIYRREFVSSLAERLGISTDDADEITAVFLDLLETSGVNSTLYVSPASVFLNLEELPIHASYKPTLRASRELRAIHHAEDNR